MIHQKDTVGLVIVTGMSGAGRSRTLSALEDFGYFCVDNVPPELIPQMAALIELPESQITRMGIACDVRSGDMFESLIEVIDRQAGPDAINVPTLVLFLDADDDVLLNRFKETRRPHPLAATYPHLLEAIQAERKMLEPIRARADLIIDTTELRASELRARIQREFLTTPLAHSLSITVSSFGFKYGMPTDADIVFDVRFLPNPFYDPELKPLSGLDEPVRDYVLSRAETQSFLDHWLPLLDEVIPQYLAEGKLSLAVALGCTGGRHRSVALTEKTVAHLQAHGYRTKAMHRDINRESNH